MALQRDANEVTVGLDEGIVVILFHPSILSVHPFQLGQDKPTYSMDPSGKLVYTRNQVIISGNVQTFGDDTTPEGNQISLSVK